MESPFQFTLNITEPHWFIKVQRGLLSEFLLCPTVQLGRSDARVTGFLVLDPRKGDDLNAEDCRLTFVGTFR
ncbi:MAG TPA: hypothetical protein DIC56_20190 [Rhizobium sp.]|nr:hypothetical protein [Rhizobium sp.]